MYILIFGVTHPQWMNTHCSIAYSFLSNSQFDWNVNHTANTMRISTLDSSLFFFFGFEGHKLWCSRVTSHIVLSNSFSRFGGPYVQSGIEPRLVRGSCLQDKSPTLYTITPSPPLYKRKQSYIQNISMDEHFK